MLNVREVARAVCNLATGVASQFRAPTVIVHLTNYTRWTLLKLAQILSQTASPSRLCRPRGRGRRHTRQESERQEIKFLVGDTGEQATRRGLIFGTADQSLSPKQKRKLAAEKIRGTLQTEGCNIGMANEHEIDLRVTAKKRRRQEQKCMQRERKEAAARETSIERAATTPSTATPLTTTPAGAGDQSASMSSGSQTSPCSVRDDTLVDSSSLPFPLADCLPSGSHAAAAVVEAIPHVCVDQQPGTVTFVSHARETFPQDPKSPSVAQGKTLPPVRCYLEEESPRLPSHGVSDPPRDATLQHISPRRSSTQTAIHQTRRRLQEMMRENATPRDTPLRAVMLHWGRLWQHPRQLYQHWLARPLFRRGQTAGGQGNAGGSDGTFRG